MKRTHKTVAGYGLIAALASAALAGPSAGQPPKSDQPAPAPLFTGSGTELFRGLFDYYGLAPLRTPILAIPGNHDAREAMREALAAEGYLPAHGFLHYAVEQGPLRFVGLDTLVPGQGGGELGAERLAWLDATLSLRPDVPTLVLMHHPPFLTGIAHMDRIGLQGREGFAAVMRRHDQVEAILCGHVHRPMHARVGGRPAMISPSPAHQVALDLRPEGPSAFRLEPPGYMLHRWQNRQLVSHTAVLGDWPGPFPFFDASGKLID